VNSATGTKRGRIWHRSCMSLQCRMQTTRLKGGKGGMQHIMLEPYDKPFRRKAHLDTQSGF